MPLQEVHTGFTFNFDGSKLAAVQRGVKRASTNLDTIAAKTEAFTSRVGGAFRRVGQMIGAYVGYRAVRMLTTDYAKGADAVAKFATATGLSTERYQGLIHAVEIGGTDQANLNKALTQLSKRALEAGQGLTQNIRAFKELGISWNDAEGKLKSGDQLFVEMADGLVNLEDKEKRTGIAMQLLGRSGATLLPTLLTGSKGIQAMIAEAKKLGKVLSLEQLKAAEKYNDEMLRVKSVLEGVRNMIASRILPVFTRYLEAFRRWWVEGDNAKRALRALKLVALFTGIVIGRMIGASVIRHITLFVKGIWAGVQALRAMGVANAFATWEVWLFIAAIALVYLIVDDLVGFVNGKDSLIGRFLGDSDLAKKLKKALLDFYDTVKKAWAKLQPKIEKLVEKLGKLAEKLKPLAELVAKIGWYAFIAAVEYLTFELDALSAKIEVVTDLVSGLTDTLSKGADIVGVAWEEVADDIGDVWKDLEPQIKAVAKAMGIDLDDLAKKTKTIWKGVFGAVGDAIDWVISKAQKALELLRLVTGKPLKATVGVASFAKFAINAATPEMASDGTPIVRGLRRGRAPTMLDRQPLQPAPAFGFGAGTNLAGKTYTTTANIAPGAVQLNVTTGSGDPKQIAAVVAPMVKKGIGKAFTNASRDLVKPPKGQQ